MPQLLLGMVLAMILLALALSLGRKEGEHGH